MTQHLIRIGKKRKILSRNLGNKVFWEKWMKNLILSKTIILHKITIDKTMSLLLKLKQKNKVLAIHFNIIEQSKDLLKPQIAI